MTTYTIDEFREHVAAGKAYDPDETKIVAPVQRVEAGSDGDRTVRFRITTNDVDRANDVINPKGWDLKAYKQNPVVLWGHSHADLPIGKTIRLSRDKHGLSATAKFVPADTPEVGPRAEAIRQLIKGGFLSTASVGFRPTKVAFNAERGGMDFEKQELLEWSVVSVPMLASAVVEQRALAQQAGVDLDVLEEWGAPFDALEESDAMPDAMKDTPTLTDDELRALCAERGIALQAAPEPDLSDDDDAVIEFDTRGTDDDAAPTSAGLSPDAVAALGAVATLSKTVERLVKTMFDDRDPAPAGTDQEVLLEFEAHDLSGAMASLLDDSLREVATAATRDAIRQARGRVD